MSFNFWLKTFPEAIINLQTLTALGAGLYVCILSLNLITALDSFAVVYWMAILLLAYLISATKTTTPKGNITQAIILFVIVILSISVLAQEQQKVFDKFPSGSEERTEAQEKLMRISQVVDYVEVFGELLITMSILFLIGSATDSFKEKKKIKGATP